MNSIPWSAKLPPMSPMRAFITVGSGVFLFIFLGSALVTYLMPEMFRARARVVAPAPAHVELLLSSKFLQEVSQHLDLPKAFAALYGQTEPLEYRRVENLLRRSMQVKRSRGTNLVEILVYNRSAAEAARLANAIAEVAAAQAARPEGSITIVEGAVAPGAPSRPNKALNLALGAAVGLFLGIMAGGVGAKLAVGFEGPAAKVE